MAFKSITTSHFDKKFSKLTGKNLTFKHQVINKMKCIRQNPEIGEPKRYNLRGLRALHISEHFVVVYRLPHI
jgi:mRNA-degrading endonuclease YafQ of YafQ-DinJ toxin-antitoxin module